MLSFYIQNQWLEYVEAVSGSLLNRGSASSNVTASAIRSWCVPAQGFFILRWMPLGIISHPVVVWKWFCMIVKALL
ncbi:hypothetical protein NC652_016873 [Populus alba x Populus x berolinensis]|nr:hypothetical protein NC652_016873 [Populus alba x Populus x berolinensis]